MLFKELRQNQDMMNILRFSPDNKQDSDMSLIFELKLKHEKA